MPNNFRGPTLVRQNETKPKERSRDEAPTGTRSARESAKEPATVVHHRKNVPEETKEENVFNVTKKGKKPLTVEESIKMATKREEAFDKNEIKRHRNGVEDMKETFKMAK